MVVDNRVSFLGIGTPGDDQIRVLKVVIRVGVGTRAKYSRQTDDAWSVSSSVATIYVVSANHLPHELLREKVHLVGRAG